MDEINVYSEFVESEW